MSTIMEQLKDEYCAKLAAAEDVAFQKFINHPFTKLYIELGETNDVPRTVTEKIMRGAFNAGVTCGIHVSCDAITDDRLRERIKAARAVAEVTKP